jgi:hypothetical protein
VARGAADLVGAFGQHLRGLEVTRKRMEALLARGSISHRDVDKMYEALFLSAFTRFESMIEDLFLGLLTKRITHSSTQVRARAEFTSDKIARDIVLRGRKYVDWLPYDRTETLAKAFLRGGRPFTLFTAPEKVQIGKLLVIRNTITHNSPHAIRNFRNKVVSGFVVPPRERTPARFLRGAFRAAPLQTRFEYYAAEMFSLASKICS